MQKYKLKGFLIRDNNVLDCRFEFTFLNFDECCDFLSRVSLNCYDVVKVFPIEFENEVK